MSLDSPLRPTHGQKPLSGHSQRGAHGAVLGNLKSLKQLYDNLDKIWDIYNDDKPEPGDRGSEQREEEL